MSVTKEDLGGNKVRLKISVPAKVFQDSIEKVYRKNRGQFAAQGFRRGHVPRPVIEKQNGADFFYRDALEELLPRSLQQAYDEADVEAVDLADNLQVESWSRDDGVVYTADVYVHPTVELGQYEGLEVTEHTYTVKDEDVDNAIERVRQESARWIPKEDAAAEGDMVTIDFTGRHNGEVFEGGSAQNTRLALGSHSMIDGFEEQIVGMKPGEDRTIQVTFPENYPEPTLAGQDAEFDIHVSNVEASELPELDDDFAEDVSGLPTLAEFRDTVRADLQRDMDERSGANVEAQLVNQVVRNTPIDVPPPMVERQLEEDLQQFSIDLAKHGLSLDSYLKMNRATPDNLKAVMRASADDTVRTSLVLAKLVDALNTAATSEEVDEQIGKLADKSNISLEEAKKNVTPQGIVALTNQISVAKTLARLKELANVTVIEDETPDLLLGVAPEARPEENTTEQSDEDREDRTVEE